MGAGSSASMAASGDDCAVAGDSSSGDLGEPCLLRHISRRESAVELDASSKRLLWLTHLSASGRTKWRRHSHRMGRAREEVTLFLRLLRVFALFARNGFAQRTLRLANNANNV